MRSSIAHLLVLSAIPTLSFGQSILPSASSSTYPACAVSCTVLLQAQTLCTPPTLPTSTSLTYENCFCQSPSLQALYTTPDAICAAECQSETDRALLQTWFISFCQEVGRGIDPLATAPSSTTVVTVTSTSSSSPTDVNSGGTTSSPSSPQQGQQSWIGSHWKWILMVAILIVGLIALAVLAVWLKRRHRRRVEERRAIASGFPTSDEKRREGVRSATPDLWGPHQHMHATQGWEYHSDADNNSGGGIFRDTLRKSRREPKRNRSAKGKGRVQNDDPETSVTRSLSRRKSSRGKHRERQRVTEVDNGSHSVSQSRSRSRRRRHIERDRSRDHDIEKGSIEPRRVPDRGDIDEEKI